MHYHSHDAKINFQHYQLSTMTTSTKLTAIWLTLALCKETTERQCISNSTMITSKAVNHEKIRVITVLCSCNQHSKINSNQCFQ